MIFTTYGQSRVRDCRGCGIAWLYKDAKMFGLDEYVNLVGNENVVCPISGPVLESTDQEFIDQMEACPSKFKKTTQTPK